MRTDVESERDGDSRCFVPRTCCGSSVKRAIFHPPRELTLAGRFGLNAPETSIFHAVRTVPGNSQESFCPRARKCMIQNNASCVYETWKTVLQTRRHRRAATRFIGGKGTPCPAAAKFALSNRAAVFLGIVQSIRLTTCSGPRLKKSGHTRPTRVCCNGCRSSLIRRNR
jgi:hypothetical protein